MALPSLFGHAAEWGLGAWTWLAVPVAVYVLITTGLLASGRSDEDGLLGRFCGRIADTLERVTGFPGWSMAGALSALMALLIVVIGFYWDVAWHIDYGRDVVLFTPAHVMILVGLAGLAGAGVVAVVFASVAREAVGVRLGRLRLPWSALLLIALGVGAVLAFPLDELWHRAYGIDVTLWSPTHLQLLIGGSAGTIAMLLMTAEALPAARPTLLGRAIVTLAAGTVLVGMTTFQGEFDFGVPQFQLAYLPVLIAAAAGFSLVLARVALGPWGALLVATIAVLLRATLAIVIAGALDHTMPRFPLYLPSALLVEAAAWAVGTSRRLRFAVVAGVLVGTAGLAGELVWVVVSGWSPQAPAALLPKVAVLGPVAALAAALLGAGLARAFAPGSRRMPVGVLVLAGALLVGALAAPLPRRVGDVAAVVRLDAAGDLTEVAVDLDPPDAARSATAFAVLSWQGGGSRTAPLEEVAPGRYRTTRPVPVSGAWKSMVVLYRGDETMAAPVYLPADPEIGASAVPAVPERRVTFQRNTEVLLREAHDGPAWPAMVAFAGVGALVALWVGLMAATARNVPPPPGPGPAAGFTSVQGRRRMGASSTEVRDATVSRGG